MSNFLSIVNSAIAESGADLDQFDTDGSDFNATGFDPLMYKFKTWVARAWQTIQQEAFDWQFMSEQAVVNLTPGIMFYSQEPITFNIDDLNPFIIYDVDDSIRVQGLTVSAYADLTSRYNTPQSWGYVNVAYDDYTLTNQHSLDFGLKAGGEYFNSTTAYNLHLVSLDGSLITAGVTPLVGGEVFALQAQGMNAEGTLIAQTPALLAPNVAGTVISYSATNSVVVEITSQTFNFMNSLEALIANPEIADIAVQVALSLDGVTASTFLVVHIVKSPNSHDSVFTTGTGDYNAAKEVGFVGGNVSIDASALVGTTIDRIDIISDLSGVTNSYDNDGEITQLVTATDDIIPRVVVNITDQSLLDALYLLAQNPAENYTVQGYSGDTLIITAFTSIIPETTDIFTYIYTQGIGSVSKKFYIHSWKSFDWAEERGVDDFVGPLEEIDEQSFKLVAHENPAPGLEIKLQFVSWEQFRIRYDNATNIPSQPRFVTKDNVGRWRFYPPMDRPYTVLFDYVRLPQVLTKFNDIPKGISADFYDMIMWLALVYYGSYDEQPSVVSRATKFYKDLLFRLELKSREKFHFVPAKLY